MKTFKDILYENTFKSVSSSKIPKNIKGFLNIKTIQSKNVEIIDGDELMSGVVYVGESKTSKDKYYIILSSFDFGRDFKISFNNEKLFKDIKSKIRDQMNINEYIRIGFKGF